MTGTLKQQLIASKKLFEETISNSKELRNNIKQKIEKTLEYFSRYQDSWAGDWTENSNLYRKNFDSSSEHGFIVDIGAIKNDLNVQSGINIDELMSSLKNISQSFLVLKDFIITELSFIRNFDVYMNETELMNQIEEFQWGMKFGDHVYSKRPKFAYVYDPTILNKGLPPPPHIVVEDEVLYIYSKIKSYENFEILVHRLIRQLELRSLTRSEDEMGSVFQQQALKAIIEKFHTVALQLKNRHDQRSSITIADEYDVQDLMNSLLRINFEDIRKEEYTPSYAGSSTRIDFLLKREKILIEVKKTRSTLRDKIVGEELIIDIAHYQSHPDCKHLICFVYDPDNLIVNPRGLEDDLNRNTTENMIVEVYVRP